MMVMVVVMQSARGPLSGGIGRCFPPFSWQMCRQDPCRGGAAQQEEEEEEEERKEKEKGRQQEQRRRSQAGASPSPSPSLLQRARAAGGAWGPLPSWCGGPMLPGGSGSGSGSGVGVLWALLSCCLLAACSLGFLSPAWVVRQEEAGAAGVSFGLLWRCPTSGVHVPGTDPCPPDAGAGGGGHAFSTLGSFAGIPSSAWQTSAILCGGGCVLLAVSALLAVTVLFLPGGQCERRVCTLAAYIQMAAVFIMAFGLLVYPFGLASAAVRKHCGNTGVYYAGDCRIGWGYMLAIVGVMLSVFLPFFAKYTPKEQASPTPIPTIL